MSSGWISLHRKIMENRILTRGRTYSRFEAFIYMLLKANHKSNKVVIGNQLINVKTGSFVTSQKKLMNLFNWGSAKLRAFLELLKKDGMIELKATNLATQITILKYDSYQNIQKSNGNQSEINQKTNRNQTETNNNDIIKFNKDNKEIRETKFRNKSIEHFEKMFPNDVENHLEDFCDYWTESNDTGIKMKFEMQRTFDVKRRISNWIKKSKEWDRSTNTITGLKAADFMYEPNGYNRMGRCSSCNTIVFGDKFTIHKDDTKCCKAKFIPHK